MAPRSGTIVVAGAFAAAAAATVVAAIVDSGAPQAGAVADSAALEAAARAQLVQETTMIVLADTCDESCMDRVRARLAPNCTAVTVLSNIHMISARCGSGEPAAANSAEGGAAAAADAASAVTHPPPVSVKDLLAGLPEVEDTVPDSVVSTDTLVDGASDGGADALRVPMPKTKVHFWGLDRINQRALPLDCDSSTKGCYPKQGRGVHVFVLDSGCAFKHPQFERRAISKLGTNVEYRMPIDDTGHGSHVAGIVGGRDTGVAPKVSLTCLKVVGRDGMGASSGVIATIDSVAAFKRRNPAKPVVMVASLSAYSRAGARDPRSIAATRASRVGVVVVVCAGNDRADACRYAPAAAVDVISVASTTHMDMMSEESNRGPCVDMAAPGEDILSVDAAAVETGGLMYASGTSMAAPHVAGAAALVMAEAGPLAGRLTAEQVYSRLSAGSATMGPLPLLRIGMGCKKAPGQAGVAA